MDLVSMHEQATSGFLRYTENMLRMVERYAATGDACDTVVLRSLWHHLCRFVLAPRKHEIYVWELLKQGGFSEERVHRINASVRSVLDPTHLEGHLSGLDELQSDGHVHDAVDESEAKLSVSLTLGRSE